MSDEETRIGNVEPLFKDGGYTPTIETAAATPDRATARLAIVLAIVRGVVHIAVGVGGGAIMLLAAVGLLALVGR